MGNEIRDFGIGIIGNVPWGTHLCQFYQTKEDLMEILVPYLKAGLENNELCVWVTPQFMEVEEAKVSLEKAIPDFNFYLEKGQIEIIPCTGWYIKEGVSDSQRALNGLAEKASQSSSSGYDGLRFVENICQPEKESRNDLINYEKRLDSVTGRYPVIALCTYSLEMLSINDIIEVVANHEFVLAKKEGKWEKTENSRKEKTAGCKQVKQAFQESEARYKSLYANSLDGILLTKPDGTILSANPQACYLHGMTENEIIQAGRSGLVVNDEKLATALKERKLTGKMNAELTCKRKDGSTFVCNVTSNLFEDADGSIKTSMIVRDITEHKKAEEALRKSEEHYRMLFTNMTEGFLLAEMICDKNGKPYDYRFLDLNPAYELNTGIKREKVLGKSALEALPNVSRVATEKFGEVALSGKQARFEVFSQEADKYFDVYSFSPEKGKFAVIFRDITERKQMEKELKESERQSRELAQSIEVERARLAAILENLPVGVWIADQSGHLTGKNREADRIWAGDAPLLEDIYEYAEYAAWYADSGKLLASEEYPVARALLTGKPIEPVELHVRRFDGTEGVVLVSAVPIKDVQGQLMGAIGINLDITRLKQTEKELQESEENYRNIVETATEGIWTSDSEAKVVYVNKRMAEMLGYTPDGMIGRYIWDFSDEEGKPIIKKNIEKRRQGIDERYEFKLIRKDGSPLWAIVSSKALFDKAGKFAGSMSLLTDITMRKEAEAKLKETLDSLEEKVKERTMQLERAYKSLEESEKSLAEAQRMAHLGNWEWDIATDKVYWSDEAYRIFGLKPQELKITLSIFLNYVHQVDRKYVNNAIKRALNGESYSIDFRIILTEEEERIVHAQGEAAFDENNIPVRMRGTVQDITESKLAQQKIQESEEKYRSFIENFRGIAFQANENFIPVFMHGTVEEITGYSEEEFMSEQPWKDIIHPEDLPRIYEEEKKIRDSPYSASGEIDFRIIRKDRKTKWVHEIYQKIPGKNGKPDRYQGTIYDITERKEAEETLAKIDEIRIKEIHHRIKNNLQVISSLLDLQAETFSHLETCKTPEVVEAFMESQNRVISMALIHEELYKGDKIDTLDFAAYLRKLTEDLFSSYNPGNKDISFKLALEQVDLSMDTAIPLGIVVNELVSNSFKHAFPAGGRGEIRINLQKSDDSVARSGISASEKECVQKNGFQYILTVSDNGKGIPEEMDIENSNSLGLELVNILVDQIDGCIEFERDHGTKFTIWFSDVDEKKST